MRAKATMASATAQEGQPAHSGKVMSWLRKVFELNPGGPNWARAVLFLDVMLAPLVLFWSIGYQQYLLSALFGALLALAADPGGGYGQRAVHIVVFAAVGAGLTALGFGIGADAWGWVVLAGFVATLLAGLTVMFGVHRFVAATALNLWFIIALALANAFHQHAHITSYTWAQTLAWTGGAALWIVVTFIEWLIRGRADRPQPIAELPGDNSRRKLTRPIIMFAVIRALVIAGTMALAWGCNLSHGYWMPIAAMVAMKPSLQQATLIGVQRIVGALLGAGVAVLLLLIPANVTGTKLFAVTVGFEAVALIFLVHGVAIRFVNYALYYTAISAGVLILLDLGQPSNYGAEGYRILWALCGVAVAVVVMFLAGLLAKRGTATVPPPRPAPQPGPQPAQTRPTGR